MFLCDFLFMWIQVKAHTNCKQKFHFHYLILSNIVKLIILGLLSFVKSFTSSPDFLFHMLSSTN